MSQGQGNSMILEQKLKTTLQVLDRIESIPDVKSWADQAGVSREWLYKTMKAAFDKPPKIILREVKFEKVVRLIREHGLDAGSYPVAIGAGFRNEKALSAFLSSFYQTNFTLLKTEILQEREPVDYKWLNGAKRG
jgi:AraC-like DNA-binding protein